MNGQYADEGVVGAKRVTVEDYEYAAITAGRTRIIIGVLAFGLALFLLMARLAEVSVLRAAPEPYSSRAHDLATRADILDRNDEILATTLDTYLLYGVPGKIWDPVETTQALTAALPDLDPADIERRLTSDKSKVYLKRNLTPRERQAVFSLGMPGLEFEIEPRRIYPRGHLASHVLGWTNVDLVGAAGAERAFEQQLSADNAGPKRLSVDMRIQHALDDELRAGMKRFQAKAVAGIVMDVTTGEILAMSSKPDFDPNRFGTALPNDRLNRATMSTYELGSVFKPLTTAMALEAGIDPNEQMPVHKPIVIRKKLIKDDHPLKAPAGMFDILAKSSNRGVTLYATRVGEARQRDFLRKLGLFDRVPIELAESAAPQLPREWQDLTTATVSYGHGLSVTPLALAAASAPLFNGGWYIAPTLEYQSPGKARPRRRVMTEQTASTMTDMMRYVVTDGTGRNAAVRGYGVMGKTGTAEKPGGKAGYQENNLVTSFISAFPYEDPKYLILITYDEPQAAEGTWGYATAGWNAAPTAGAVISRMVSILGLRREDTTQVASRAGGRP